MAKMIGVLLRKLPFQLLSTKILFHMPLEENDIKRKEGTKKKTIKITCDH
jgi:hypothetical protein